MYNKPIQQRTATDCNVYEYDSCPRTESIGEINGECLDVATCRTLALCQCSLICNIDLQILMLYDVCHRNIVFMVKAVLNQVHTPVKWQN